MAFPFPGTFPNGIRDLSVDTPRFGKLQCGWHKAN